MLSELGVPFFSLTGSTTPLEAPSFQFADTVKMSQFDANNDMQLTQKQATMDIPIATHLAMLHGHHWDIAYSPFPARMRADVAEPGSPVPAQGRTGRVMAVPGGAGPDRLSPHRLARHRLSPSVGASAFFAVFTVCEMLCHMWPSPRVCVNPVRSRTSRAS